MTETTSTPNDLLPDSGCPLSILERFVQIGKAMIELTDDGVDLPLLEVGYDTEFGLRIELDYDKRVVRIVQNKSASYVYGHEINLKPHAIKQPNLQDIKKYLSWISNPEETFPAPAQESVEQVAGSSA